MKKLIVLASLAVLILAGIWWYVQQNQTPPPPPPSEQPIATAHYECDQSKSIDAQFFEGQSSPGSAGVPPQPGGSAKVQLSDGRSMTLQQTISADGVRYSNGNPQKKGSETLTFWSKGNGALVLENNDQQTYVGCIQVAPNPGGVQQIFESGSLGFSIRYPEGYSVDSGYKYQALGPGKDISGVRFSVGSSTVAGTNLAPDTALSVEEIPGAASCSADLFLPNTQSATASTGSGQAATTTTLKIGTREYSVATSSDAAAGNRYEESVYALPGTNPCLAVRYFVHYGVLQNYPAGSVQPYDDDALRALFDNMLKTLTVQQ